MTQKNAKNVKLAVSALTLCLVAPNALLNQAQAGMITGVAPEMVGGNKVYNIDPTVNNGDIGFRIYEYFKLNKDEVANLIFKYNGKDISKFVNLVDNQIDINGLVNSVNADGSFNNGHVMFVSPNGMVVGASGVLNLGSLTVLTPEYNNYKKFTTDLDIKGPLAVDTTNLYSQGTGTVTIDGKVIARDLVDIRAAAVDINNSIMAGVKNNEVFTSNSQADILFNSLVNTDNMKAGNNFASESGSIKITAYSGSDGINTAAGSTLKNFGKGDVELTSYGAKGIEANGDIKNPNGNVRLTTTNGVITTSGNIENANGNVEITSAKGILIDSSSNVKNTKGNTTLKSNGGFGIEVNGTVENIDGNLTLDNSVSGGIVVNNSVKNSNGNITYTNAGEDGTVINGSSINSNGNSTYTNKSGEFTVNGLVQNSNGNLDIVNNGTGIKVAKDASVQNLTKGDLSMTNTGANGIDIQGLVKNENGNSTFINDAGAFEVADAGYVTNANGTLKVTNNGTGIKIIGMLNNKNGNLEMTNTGENGIVINGFSSNENGDSTYLNEAGEFTVNKSINNKDGNLKITNNGTGIKVSENGLISNENGDMTIENTGVNGILVDGYILNDVGNLSMTNAGEASITVNDRVVNTKGNSTYTNKSGEFTVNGLVENSNGDLLIINNGTGVKVAQNANVQNLEKGDLYVYNSGANGILIAGVLANENGLVNLENTGANGIVVNGQVNNKSGQLSFDNSGEAGTTVNGSVINLNGTSHYTNKAGSYTVNGFVKNENGDLTVHNTGTGVKVSTDATVTNDGGYLAINNSGKDGILVDGVVYNNGTELSMVNEGIAGITINGSSINEKGNSTYTNKAGKFLVNGNVQNANGTLKVDNSGTGIEVSNSGQVLNLESGDLEMTNTGADGILIAGKVFNEKGNLSMTNAGAAGMKINGSSVNADGNSTYLNKNGSLDVNGEVYNNGDLTMTNAYSGINNGFNIAGKVTNDKGATNLTNNGGDNFHVKESGIVTANGTVLNINNTISGIKIDGTVNSNSDSMTIDNTGFDGIEINGFVNNNKGDAVIRNNSGEVHGDAVLIGNGIRVNKTGKVYTAKDTTLLIQNDENSHGLDFNGILVDGEITSDGNSLTLENSSYHTTINGQINNHNGIAQINNRGRFGGIKLNPQGQINSKGTELKLYNEGSGNVQIQGKITHDNKAGKVQITSKNSDVVIGHTDTNSNITSNGNVTIEVEDGNIYNYGVANKLIHMTDNASLDMYTANGEIGKDDGNCGAACIGIGPVSRDFTKSINVTSDGKITAVAKQGKLANDVVANIAGFNSDLNIDQVKADGKVILTTADFDNNGNGYSILNASTDSTKANVEGKGFALIASDKIGEADNKLTFNQTAGKFNKDGLDIESLSYTPTAEYGVEMLAINDINVKGHDDKYDTHVCTMISREGTIDAEFSGDTYIREITADKGLKVVTRGAELVIDNLGKVPNTPEDYFGPNGNISPEEVVVKALDINPNTRVDMEEIDGVKHWADSHIIIRDGVVDDKARVTLVGDEVYAGGYHFHMGKDRNPEGKAYYEVDDRTAMETTLGEAPKIRVEAVRPGDVTSIGRDKDERNYYGGGSVQEDQPWYDDDDDDDDKFPPTKPDEIFPGDDDDDDDDDHLTVPEPEDEPIIPPPGDDDDDDQPDPPPSGDDDDDDQPDPPPSGDDDDDDQPDPPPSGDDDDDDQPDPPPPGDDDDDDQPDPPPSGDDDDDDQPDLPPSGDDDDDDQPDPPPSGDDGDDDQGYQGPSDLNDARMTWKREIGDSISVIDKRQYMRFSLDRTNVPVSFTKNDKISSVLDISRGGIAVSHNNTLKVGDVVPVQISYGDVDINTNVKIVTASDVRAGAEFVDLDSTTANRILYLNLLLEEEYKLSQAMGAQI